MRGPFSQFEMRIFKLSICFEVCVCGGGGDKNERIFGTTTNISGFCRATERPSKQSTPPE